MLQDMLLYLVGYGFPISFLLNLDLAQLYYCFGRCRRIANIGNKNMVYGYAHAAQCAIGGKEAFKSLDSFADQAFPTLSSEQREQEKRNKVAKDQSRFIATRGGK